MAVIATGESVLSAACMVRPAGVEPAAFGSKATVGRDTNRKHPTVSEEPCEKSSTWTSR